MLYLAAWQACLIYGSCCGSAKVAVGFLVAKSSVFADMVISDLGSVASPKNSLAIAISLRVASPDRVTGARASDTASGCVP